MFTNHHHLTGTLTIEVYNSRLNRRWQTRVNNLITTTGKQTLARHFINTIKGNLGFHIAVGTGTTPPAVADTALVTQQASVAAKTTFLEDSTKAVTIRVKAEVPPLPENQSPQALTEAGILLAVPGQETKTLYNRVKFAPITRTQATTLNFAWDISF